MLTFLSKHSLNARDMLTPMRCLGIVQGLHDFARETRLSHEEWMTGLLFLTSVGQICTDVRQVGESPTIGC